MLPFENTDPNATLVGRVWRPEVGPCLITLRGDEVIDITAKTAPTMRDLLELDDPAAYVREATGESLGSLTGLAHLSGEAVGDDVIHFLAPCDLQAVKALRRDLCRVHGRARD